MQKLHLILFYLSWVGTEANGYVWRAFGSGLDDRISLPVRYFYVEILDNEGQRVDGRKVNDLKYEFYDRNGQRINIRKEWGVRYDGILMFRYKLHFSNDGGKLVITHNEKNVYEAKFGKMFDEACDCPYSYEEFLKIYNCPDSYPQLDEDLSHYDTIDLDRLAKAGNDKHWGTEATIHYVVKNQKIYTKRLGTITDFKMFTDGILFSLLRKVNIPDVEFIFNVGDWPLGKVLTDPVPVFSWCGSNSTTDIILPTWDQTKNTRLAMNRVSVDILSVQQESGRNPKWKNKTEKALFRGRDSNKVRLTLAELSLKHPDLLDAGMTSYNFRKMDVAKWGPKANYIPLHEMGAYKYQLLIDGTVAAYRAPYLFQAGSLILKQESEYYEWWYNSLKPNKHFIPIKKDASDVLEKVTWAKNNDKQAEEIAHAGSTLAQNLLTPENMYCYYAKAFHKYSQKQNRRVKLYDDHEHVSHDSDANIRKPCSCNRKPHEEL